MKRNELKKCALCGKGVMHAGLPLFWRITVERFGVNLAAIQRRHGMEMQLGGGAAGAVLANVLGPDEDLADKVMDPVELIVCESCGTKQPPPIAALPEYEEENHDDQ